MENGGPAPEGITDKIYSNTTTIKKYLIAEGLSDVDISIIGVTTFSRPEGQFDVDVFDSANDYVKLMKNRLAIYLRGAGGFSKSSQPYSYTKYPTNQTSIYKIPKSQPFAA